MMLDELLVSIVFFFRLPVLFDVTYRVDMRFC